MKKSQLYQLIYSLVEKSKKQNKIINADTPNFATTYCSKFLKKNKLIPKSKNEKIRQIMEQFKVVDSYVDLHDIIQQIQQYINEEMLKQYKQNMKTEHHLQTQKSINDNSQFYHNLQQQAIQVAQKMIQKSYKNGLYLQLNKCSDIVQLLQENSNELKNVKFNNNSHHLTYHQLTNKRYTENKSYFRDSQQNDFVINQTNNNNCPQSKYQKKEFGKNVGPWQILQQNNRKFTQLESHNKIKQQDIYKFNKTKTLPNHKQSNHKSKYDYAKMLNASAVYLRMILERQHYKRWALDKDYNPLKNLNLDSSISNMKTNDTQIKSPKKINKTQTQQASLGCETQTPSKFFHKKANNKVFVANIYDKKTGVDFNKKQNKESLNQSQNNENIQLKKADRLRNYNSVKTEPSLGNNIKAKLKQKPKYIVQRPSICGRVKQTSQLLLLQNSNHPNITEKKVPPRHTLGNIQNIEQSFVRKQNNKMKTYYQIKWEESKQIKQKFTFKKRKVKERVLKKIAQFVNQIQYAQRNLATENKNCQKQIQNVQQILNHQYLNFKPVEILNDENALNGVRCALSKQSTGIKRYQRNQKI